MRTFILRARKGSVDPDKLKSSIGSDNHAEVIAHVVMNAFFISNDFRRDVELYIVLDSTDDFPRTVKLSSNDGLSISGFHEMAILSVITHALTQSRDIKKDEIQNIARGVSVFGYGFEKLVSSMIDSRSIYLLDRKGDDIRGSVIEDNPVFVLSDHIPMPKNIIKSFTRRGMKSVSLGKKMLFASQCVVLINDQLDRI